MGSSVKLDPDKISRLVSPFVEHATCLDCYKFYIAPETASCGHTFCHACWRKRRSCMCCEAPLDRRSLKLNLPVQNITEHVQSMCEKFEKIFDYKVENYSFGNVISTEVESEPDPAKNVNDWLASSQNHFSAPASSDINVTTVEHNISTSTVQVHNHTKKVTSPPKVVHKQPAQEDWEKIEHLPDTDEQIIKQTKVVDNSHEYSTEHPRRSSRKRELKHDEHNPKFVNTTKDKCSSKDSSIEIDTKTTKIKQKWNNVKKMRKEFSKLNKQNRNKLNVSIEMCKKAKANSGKANTGDDPISEKVFVIEDDTPSENIKEIADKTNVDQQTVKSTNNFVCVNNVSRNSSKESQINSSKRHSNNRHDENFVTSKTNNNNIQYMKQNDKSISNVSDKIEKPLKMPFYKKGNLHIDTDRVKNNVKNINYNIDCTNSSNTDDIEITIKIGDTVANIFFKRKKNEPPKVNINQEIQTSIGIHTLDEVSNANEENLQIIEVNKEKEQTVDVMEVKKVTSSNEPDLVQPDIVRKSVSTKKNTASAETVTAQFEITESVEKELSSVMEIAEQEEFNDQHSEIIRTKSTKSTHKISTSHPKQIDKETPNMVENQGDSDILNDMDIFESGSVQEGNVHVLKDTNDTHSEIIPTIKSIKGKTQNKPKKRNREAMEDIEMTNKKQKIIQNSPKANNTDEFDKSLQKEFAMDSEGINYDAIMGQVFANIDAEIHNTQKSKALIRDTQIEKSNSNVNKKDQQKTIVLTPDKMAEDPINIEDSVYDNAVAPEGCSENVFTVIEKENESNEIIEDKDENPKSVQQEIENYLTPEVFMGTDKLCTPLQNVEDDDKSVVEETPQKTVSFTKPKNKSENAQPHLSLIKQKSMDESQVQSNVDVSDSKTSSSVSKDATIIDIARKQTETPLTINRFVDQIKHKSTPVARKSLNFENDDDPEQTLCPTTEPAKTTQEKEFMSKAFENTPKSPVRKPLMMRNVKVDVGTYCLAGSCLSSVELAKVKVLCRQNNWNYVDKYTDELTHLVVGVDEENRSQRSVKYMCALAASKWIVSFRWIDVCLNTNKIVNEEYFEALDGTGEPGPKRSRIANKKLFEGITFFCMPPFSILDVDTLKRMLEAAGGTVVKEISGVRASGESPTLLLAEPESTQENKFIYMAVELSVVPVNYEWVLNCLGSYSLCSVHELLLCPPALLPAVTARWPHQLLSQED